MDLRGAWEGEIEIPQTPLHITLKIADGNGTMDVREQNAKGLPVRVVRAEADRIELVAAVPGAPATLFGKLEGSTIVGTFEQRGHVLPLRLTRAAAHAGIEQGARAQRVSRPPQATVSSAAVLIGPWHGALKVGASQILLDARFSEGIGELVGRLDVREQALRDLPLTDIQFDGTRIRFETRGRLRLPAGT